MCFKLFFCIKGSGAAVVFVTLSLTFRRLLCYLAHNLTKTENFQSYHLANFTLQAAMLYKTRGMIYPTV